MSDLGSEQIRHGRDLGSEQIRHGRDLGSEQIRHQGGLTMTTRWLTVER